MGNEQTLETVGPVLALPVAAIHRSPYQVRREAAADPDLVASIAAHGLIHPVVVREDGRGNYELVAGHRRFAAYQAAFPAENIPASVITATDTEAEDLLVSENFLRLDLTVVEKAMTIAQLRDHGRTVAQIAELTRMNERTVYRFAAIGSLVEPWRDFLHAWDATYAEAFKIARLPVDIQNEAWDSFLGAIADKLTFTVRKGHKEDAEARRLFLDDVARNACDKSAFIARIVANAPRGRLDTPKAAEEFVESWMSGESGGLTDFLGEQRLLDPKACPFDCSDCHGCLNQSGAQPGLFDEADPARTIPRCYDAECWATKVAAAAKASSPGADGNQESSRSAPPAATSSEALPESGKKEGTTSSPAPEPGTAANAAGGKDRGPARGDSSADVAVRMGAIWCVAQLLHDDKLEDILPRLSGLEADAVRKGGWCAAVVRDALPKLKRNRVAARKALVALATEGMR